MFEVLIAIAFLLIASAAGNYFWPESHPIDPWAPLASAFKDLSIAAGSAAAGFTMLGHVLDEMRRDHPEWFDRDGYLID